MGIIVAGFALVGMLALFLFNESLYDAADESTEQRASDSTVQDEPYSHKKAA